MPDNKTSWTIHSVVAVQNNKANRHPELVSESHRVYYRGQILKQVQDDVSIGLTLVAG